MIVPKYIQTNFSLSSIINYKVGGYAQYFCMPSNLSHLILAKEFAQINNLPIIIIGCGTNLLVSDSGIKGLVIYLGSKIGCKIEELNMISNDRFLKISSYSSKAELLDYSAINELTGLEFSAGIPGTVGGGIFMNAGTKWGSYSSCLYKVGFITQDNQYQEVSSEELSLGYRSNNSSLLKSGSIIWDVTFKLQKSSREKIEQKINEILSYRGMKQPLLYPNCGSVFKNPPKNISELGAGRLIERSNLKGKKIGGAQVSLKHANFIINDGSATAKDVFDLIKHVQEVVFKNFNIHLQKEVILLGKF